MQTEIVLAERFKTLTAEDRSAISAVLSPSVTDALSKIVPEFAPLLEQIGTTEPNVVVPISLMASYSMKRYGVEDPKQAITLFYEDITTGLDQPMETQQTNVPPGNEPQGLMTSPQNMETV